MNQINQIDKTDEIDETDQRDQLNKTDEQELIAHGISLLAGTRGSSPVAYRVSCSGTQLQGDRRDSGR
jgi:hypothetical protein